MGNRFDYSYRFEGSAKKIAKARAEIEKIRLPTPSTAAADLTTSASISRLNYLVH